MIYCISDTPVCIADFKNWAKISIQVRSGSIRISQSANNLWTTGLHSEPQGIRFTVNSPITQLDWKGPLWVVSDGNHSIVDIESMEVSYV